MLEAIVVVQTRKTMVPVELTDSGLSSLVECLPSMWKALGSISSTELVMFHCVHGQTDQVQTDLSKTKFRKVSGEPCY